MTQEQVYQTPEEFVIDFIGKHSKLIAKISRRYSIPNRYDFEDIKQYISERIIQILKGRDESNIILKPEKYFKSCIRFYCIEYQRMHGYIFDLPKRPRKNCEQDERNIREFGFKYIGDITTEEFNSLLLNDPAPSLLPEEEPEEKEPGAALNIKAAWDFLTGLVNTEEARVLECVFRNNMTWAETNKALDVPQSTCWFRNNRALSKIESYFESLPGDSLSNIRSLLRSGSAT